MSGKGLISRMSDECLMKQETAIPFYVVYQAVMRKFTLAKKTSAGLNLLKYLSPYLIKFTLHNPPLELGGFEKRSWYYTSNILNQRLYLCIHSNTHS